MKKTESLCDNKRFLYIYRKGKTFVSPFFVLYTLPNKKDENRLGITVGKKAVGNAVSRNRAKRVLREAYYYCEDAIKTGNDIIIVSKRKTPYMNSLQVGKELFSAFEALSMTERN